MSLRNFAKKAASAAGMMGREQAAQVHRDGGAHLGRLEERHRSILLVLAQLLVGLGILVAVGVLGMAPARADVSPSGAFETSVAIKIPPFHGIEPRLGLSYSSTGPNGWIGQGWSLTGLSTLRRQSRGHGLPQWDASDTFSLDGRELIACPAPDDRSSPSSNIPSCAHRLPGLSAFTTRVESFQRIAAQGDPRDTFATGPERWFVWRTDGVKATYEPGVKTGRGVLEWRLSTVQDLSGNVVRYDWCPCAGAGANDGYMLRAIRYGDVEISFQGEPRPDPIHVATGGSLITTATRLQAIDELAGGQRIRAYALRYAARGNDQRQSLLESVQQYGSDAVVDASGVHGPTALPPTTFTFPQAGSSGSAAWRPTTPTAAGLAANWPAGPDDSTRFTATLDGQAQGAVPWPSAPARQPSFQWLVGDFNGDDRSDFALVKPSASDSFDVQVEFTMPDGGYRGYSTQLPWPLGGLHSFTDFTALVGDANGNGVDDLTVSVASTTGWVVGTLLGDARGLLTASFSYHSFGLKGADLLMGDVTGDGLADLVAVGNRAAPPGDCPRALRVAVGRGGGDYAPPSPPICWPTAPSTLDYDAASFQLADVNGDLRADVVAFQRANTSPKVNLPTAKIFTAISDGTGGFAAHVQDTGLAWEETTRNTFHTCFGSRHCRTKTVTQLPAFWLDADADGRSDLVVLGTGADQVTAWTAYSQGDGSYHARAAGAMPFGAGSTPFNNDALRVVTEYTPLEGTDQPLHSSTPARWLQGDFNGDGANDLGAVTSGTQPTMPQTTLRALADRAGNWTPTATTTRDWSTAGCSGNCWDPSALTRTGDINGDGQDDVLFAHRGRLDPATGQAWSAVDADTSPATPSATQVLSGDVNADGRQDLLYPTMTDAGVQVRAAQQRADGTYQTIDPVTVPVPDRHLLQGGWRVADVNCDRRDDLVNIDVNVTTLLASGAHDWQPAGSLPLSAGTVPLLATGSRWAVADVNGDGCGDLVRVGRRSTPVEWGVLALLGRTDGSWTPEWASLSSTWSPQLTDPLHWTPADVNADGQTDLVHVKAEGGAVTTLLRRTGSWTPVSVGVATNGGSSATTGAFFLATTADRPTWRGVDVNADGAVDLARVSLDRAGTVLIETLLSLGDGGYVPRTAAAGAAYGGPEAAADTQWWTPADLDHDGRGDLVRVFNRAAELVIQTAVSNGDGTWTAKSSPLDVDPTLAATSAWRIGDWYGRGHISALRLDQFASAFQVSGFTSSAAREMINTISNGLGASTTVEYSPATSMLDAEQLPPAECRLPPGASSNPVVTRVATIDAPSHAADATGTRYACPGYSAELRSLVAWRETWSTHQPAPNRPASTEHVVRDVFSSGIVQPRLDEVSDGQGVLRLTQSRYKPLGSEPQVDLLESSAVSDCAAGVCATSTVQLAHDEFGNVTMETRQAAGSGRTRRTETSYLHHHLAWLQALPRFTRTFDPAHPDVLLRAAYTCYDGDTSADCNHPPSPLFRPRGLATLTRAWDDRSQSFVVTGQAGWDAFGNQTTTTDANGNTSTVDFDPWLHQHPIKVCNAKGQCSQQPEPWDRRADAPQTVTDANGAITNHTYDPIGRPRTTRRPTNHTYDSIGRPHTTRPTGALDTITYRTDATVGTVTLTTTTAPGVTHWLRTFTDGLGRQYLVEHPHGDGRVVQVETAYSDASNRPFRRAVPRFAGAPPVWETFRYDAAGRLVEQTHPDASAITHQYLVRDGLTVAEDRDETGRTQTRSFDGWGALIDAEQPSPDHLAHIHYTYNAVDEAIEVTDAAGNTTRTSFDTLGHITSQVDPDRGTTAYLYDRVGNLKQQTDARGRILTYYYDELNRRIKKQDQASRTTSVWNYDEPGHGASLGRLTTVQDPSATGCRNKASRSLSYDLGGNVTKDVRCIRGIARTFRSQYDALDRLKTLTYPGTTTNPSGEQLTYTYDAAGDLFSVSGYVRAMRYNPRGQLAAIDYANHTSGHWTYDRLRGWLTGQDLVDAKGRPLFDSSYEPYDPNGLLRGTSSKRNHTAETYGYDSLGRLQTVTGSWQQQLSYDGLGNLTSNSRIGTYRYLTHRHCTANGTAEHCAGPHAVTTAGTYRYDYDPAGNMTTVRDRTRVIRQLTWNSDGLLSRIDDRRAGSIQNLYDADGTRVQQTTRQGSTNFYGRLADWSPKTGLTNYIYAGQLLVARSHGTQRRWYTLDRLGSPRAITDQAGHVTARLNYAPYGQTISRSGPTEAIGYTGHHTIGGTDLLDMVARSYDPRLARMLSADTIIPDPADPQALNRYSYAYNNPTHYIDPTGHKAIEPPPGDSGLALYEFFLTSARYAAVGPQALNQPILHEQVFISPTEKAILKFLTVPTRTPSSSSAATAGAAAISGASRTRSANFGIGTLKAPWADDQTPQTSKPASRKARKATIIEFSETEASEIVVPGVQDDFALQHELSQIRNVARPNLEKEMVRTRQEAKSSIIGAIPVVGGFLSAAYDFFRGDPMGGVQSLAEEGLEKSGEKLLPKSTPKDIPWAAPWDAWQMHKDMRAHGENVNKMRALEWREYQIMRKLGSPEARYDLGYKGYYLGPDGRLHKDQVPVAPLR
jgi:RHS repeat-associated protein